MSDLNPTKAFIFRIVHVDCVPWILENGLHCRTSIKQDLHYINIGSAELIDKRSRKMVPIPPEGSLSDYVPFYFTPYSIMMYNIRTGYGGITKRENKDIVIFVSSLHHIHKLGLPYIFTDQHAYAAGTEFFSDLAELSRIDWTLLQNRNFKTNDADPGRQLRYQAEALVHRHVPLNALLGIGCHSDAVRQKLESIIAASGGTITVKTTPKWYF